MLKGVKGSQFHTSLAIIRILAPMGPASKGDRNTQARVTLEHCQNALPLPLNDVYAHCCHYPWTRK